MSKLLFQESAAGQSGASIIDLEAHVLSRIGKQVGSFRLVIQDRGLILKGRSLSYYVKQLAQQAVMEATEIPIVRNEIEVICCNQKNY